MVFCISVVWVVMSPFSFLILFILVLSLFFLVSLARGLSILFILSKNQLLVLLIFFYLFKSIFYLFPLWSLLFPSFCWLRLVCFLIFVRWDRSEVQSTVYLSQDWGKGFCVLHTVSVNHNVSLLGWWEQSLCLALCEHCFLFLLIFSVC